MKMPRRCLCLSLMAAACGIASLAWAQTDEIQVYDASIASVGGVNLTLHNNYTPSGSSVPEFPGALTAEGTYNGAAEWGFGLTPWWEAGLYLPLYSVTKKGSVLYDGAKLRTLFVVPDADKRRFFYGVNFEYSFNTAHWDNHARSVEVRPIVGAHLGRFDFIFNPILDSALNGLGRVEFAPSTRIAIALSDTAKLALEEYANLGPVDHFRSSSQQVHTLFAVVDFRTRWVEIEAGVGVGLTSATDHCTIKLILTKDL